MLKNANSVMSAKFMMTARIWPVVGLMFFAITGCKTRGYNLSSEDADKSKSTILVHCMSAQGNGGNWSSTLGWIAADYLQIADRADLAAASGRPVLIYPRCFSGGSSGSAVVNVVMSLLSNYAVLSPGDGNDGLRKAGFFTATDMRDYARAIRFLGLSTDMSVLETAYFLAGTLRDTAFAQSKLPDPSKQANWWSGVQASPEGAVLDFSKIVYAASRITREELNKDIGVVFAQSAKNQRVFNSLKERAITILNNQIKDENGQSLFDSLRLFAQENKISTVSDFPNERAIADLNCSVDTKKCAPGRIRAAMFLMRRDQDPATEEARKRYAKFYLIEAFQAYHAGNYVDGLVAGDPLNKTSFSKEFAKAAKTQGSGSALTESLRLPLDAGYFTFTAAGLSWGVDPKMPKKEREFYDNAPTFDALRFVVFSDKSTAAAIRKSPLYIEQSRVCTSSLQQNLSPVCRFVIAEIAHRVHSMLPSVREPGLMAELYAPAFSATAGISEHLGAKRFFDPRDVRSGDTLEDAVVDLEDRSAKAPQSSLYFAVAGGWPDRRIGAWMLMYYMDTLLGDDPDFGVKAQFAKALGGASVEPALAASVSIFGKPDSTADFQMLDNNVNDAGLLQKFDVKQVSSVFSRGTSSEMPPMDSAVSSRSRKSYLKMMGLFYGFFTGNTGRLDRPGIPVQLMETMNNWDLSEIKGLPAYLAVGRDSGASRYLLSLSHNTVNEGLIALDQKLPPSAANSTLQYCSLATFQRDKTKKIDIRELPKGTLFKDLGKGDVTVNRIQCVRRMNSDQSGQAFKKLFNRTYRDELRELAAKATVTFNVLDPRINLGRKDAGLVIKDVSTVAPMVLSSDELPPISDEQKEILLMNTDPAED
jgi:hypothetical protein